MTQQDKIRGSLMGGAIGDALGYPVEFITTYEAIQQRYGEQGITRFDLRPHWLQPDDWTGKAIVSDDTQMTLYTACGLLNAPRRQMTYLASIKRAYMEWLSTQDSDFVLSSEPNCWVTNVPEMHHRRAPGMTCLSSLKLIARRLKPNNRSKGCGGVMRIAPIPLYGAVQGRMTIDEADRLASDAAEITHQHPLGVLPAALMAHLVYRIMQDEATTPELFQGYVAEGIERLRALFPHLLRDIDYLARLVHAAVTLAGNDRPDVENIELHIGQGWVAEETLAIAIYCVLRHFGDFEKTVIASVNHKGDSDSTGAVAGNIVGVITGYEAIPRHFTDSIEMHDVILRVADELH